MGVAVGGVGSDTGRSSGCSSGGHVVVAAVAEVVISVVVVAVAGVLLVVAVVEDKGDVGGPGVGGSGLPKVGRANNRHDFTHGDGGDINNVSGQTTAHDPDYVMAADRCTSRFPLLFVLVRSMLLLRGSRRSSLTNCIFYVISLC